MSDTPESDDSYVEMAYVVQLEAERDALKARIEELETDFAIAVAHLMTCATEEGPEHAELVRAMDFIFAAKRKAEALK